MRCSWYSPLEALPPSQLHLDKTIASPLLCASLAEDHLWYAACQQQTLTVHRASSADDYIWFVSQYQQMLMGQ